MVSYQCDQKRKCVTYSPQLLYEQCPLQCKGADVQNNQAYDYIFKFCNKAEAPLGPKFVRNIVVYFALIVFFST